MSTKSIVKCCFYSLDIWREPQPNYSPNNRLTILVLKSKRWQECLICIIHVFYGFRLCGYPRFSVIVMPTAVDHHLLNICSKTYILITIKEELQYKQALNTIQKQMINQSILLVWFEFRCDLRTKCNYGLWFLQLCGSDSCQNIIFIWSFSVKPVWSCLLFWYFVKLSNWLYYFDGKWIIKYFVILCID